MEEWINQQKRQAILRLFEARVPIVGKEYLIDPKCQDEYLTAFSRFVDKVFEMYPSKGIKDGEN